jgi:hypothetical protein
MGFVKEIAAILPDLIKNDHLCGLVSAISGCRLRFSSRVQVRPSSGWDIDQAKIDQINAGRSYIKHIAAGRIGKA